MKSRRCVRKIINYLVVFVVIFVSVVLFTPLSLFERNINDLANRYFHDGTIKIKGLDYQLSAFNFIQIDEVQLVYLGQSCNLRDFSLRLKPLKLINKKINIEFIKAKIIDCNLVKSQVEKKREQKKVHGKNLFRSLKIDEIKFESINVSYEDIIIQGLNTQIKQFEIKKIMNPVISLNYSIKANMIKKQDKSFHDISLAGSYNNNVIKTSSLSIKKPKLLMESLSLDIKDNISGHVNLKEIVISDWIDKVDSYQLKAGKIYGDLSFVDLNINQGIVSSVNSNIEGANLVVKGVDLDTLLKNYIESNENNYLDVAGFLALGPVGFLVSKTTKLSKSIPGIGSGETYIDKFVLKTNFSNSILQLDEVGVKTKKHKLVLKGDINISSKKLKLKFAPVDNNGCPIFIQKIKGTIKNPDIGAMKTLAGNLFSPITDLLKKSKQAITDCDKFYNGSSL